MTSMPSTSETIPESVEQLITTLENGQRPWFTKSAEVYDTVKHAASALPLGGKLFESSLAAVCSLTHSIEANTHLHIALDVEQSHELINQLDALVSEQAIVVDDGMDHLRARLAVSVRHLLSAIVLHTNWATESAKRSTRTRYEVALDMLKLIVAKVQELRQTAEARGMEFITFTTETASHLSIAGKDKLVSVSKTTWAPMAMWALATAQPWVRLAVKHTQPYAHQALELSQPYVDKAMPYVDPWINKAKELNGKVLESKVVGPLVAQAESFAIDSAEHLLQETQEYCLADTPAPAPVDPVQQ